MSSGYAANYGWTMSFEKAREIAPAAIKKFKDELDAYDQKWILGSSQVQYV